MANFRAAVSFSVGFFVVTPLALNLCASARGESPGKTQASLASEKSAYSDNSAQQMAKELRAAVRAALKTAATAKGREQEEAARTLVVLYRELGQDASLTVPERAGLSASVRYRLARISKQLQSQMARDKDHASRGKRTRAPQKPTHDAELLGKPEQSPVAAQQFPFAAQQAPRGGNPFGQGQFGQGQFGQGQFGQGPFQQPQFGPMAAPAVADHGQELVELIENTIAPDTWAVHGGEGTIYYFRPSFALIVNQSADAHDQLGGLLRQLGK